MNAIFRTNFVGLHCWTFTCIAFVVTTRPVSAQNQYPFVGQFAGNRVNGYICAGLACGIERLEEGTQVTGIEDSRVLARRLWNAATDGKRRHGAFEYGDRLRLRDGTVELTCSKSAIEEIGFLLQEHYRSLIDGTLWQVGKDANSPTPAARALRRMRNRYEGLCSTRQPYSIASRADLKALVDTDKDGLIALAGRGHRYFEQGTPRDVIEERNLTIDRRTGRFPRRVPSDHAFLVSYDKDRGQFNVHDPDDPDGHWSLTVEGTDSDFRVQWRIDDHMGHGPTQQSYSDVRPLNVFLRDIRAIVDDAESTSDN